MKSNGIFPMSRDNDVGQHVSPTNIPGPQEPKRDIIYFLGTNWMAQDIDKRKKRIKNRSNVLLPVPTNIE